MAQLKHNEAKLYDRLAVVAPTMTQGLICCTSQLPEYVDDMYTHIIDPQKFRVALAAGGRLTFSNIIRKTSR